MASINVCVSLTKTTMSKKIELTEEDYRKEEVIDNLMKHDEEKLKDVHAKGYSGTDDDMTDAYENWLMSLTSEQILHIIQD